MRICSLLPSATEIALAVGAGDAVVGVSHECDFPASIRGKPRATVSFIDSSRPSEQIDEEVKSRLGTGLPLHGLNEPLLRDLAPDFIVTQAQCDVCAIQYDDVLKLVASSPEFSQTKVLALSPNSLEEILQDVLRVGEAVGLPDKAKQLESSLRQRVDRASSLTRSLDPSSRPRVICVEWTSPLMTAGNWTPELIELAGGQSGLASPREHSRYVTWPEIVDFDPQVLLVAPCGFDLRRSEHEAQELPALPGWSAVSAVKAGRVFVLDGNALLNRSGPRIVDSLELLAHLLHPSRFPAPGGFLAEGSAWRPLASR